MALSAKERLKYLISSGLRAAIGPETDCPSCGSTETSLVRRKYLVTALWQCRECQLRFRVPKEGESASATFYQESYSEGFTTDCPSDDALAVMRATRFEGLEKDFRRYIAVLGALGLKEGDSILDFGCSWGYGSWQLAAAGFRVFSYEISRPRAEYARRKMDCRMVESLEEFHEPIDCLFSAHVIEHLPKPDLIWETAGRLLGDNGSIVCICPNGDPVREQAVGLGSYDQLWGKVHPLLITPQFLKASSARHGWVAKCYTRPFEADKISNSVDGDCGGDELCMIARRPARPAELPSEFCA